MKGSSKNNEFRKVLKSYEWGDFIRVEGVLHHAPRVYFFSSKDSQLFAPKSLRNEVGKIFSTEGEWNGQSKLGPSVTMTQEPYATIYFENRRCDESGHWQDTITYKTKSEFTWETKGKGSRRLDKVLESNYKYYRDFQHGQKVRVSGTLYQYNLPKVIGDVRISLEPPHFFMNIDDFHITRLDSK